MAAIALPLTALEKQHAADTGAVCNAGGFKASEPDFAFQSYHLVLVLVDKIKPKLPDKRDCDLILQSVTDIKCPFEFFTEQ
jgi:hypothetical protein